MGYLPTRDFVVEAKIEPIADIGQIPLQQLVALRRAVRRGEIAKWRGAWFPVCGAPHGLLPLKTCFGPVDHPFAQP